MLDTLCIGLPVLLNNCPAVIVGHRTFESYDPPDVWIVSWDGPVPDGRPIHVLLHARRDRWMKQILNTWEWCTLALDTERFERLKEFQP